MRRLTRSLLAIPLLLTCAVTGPAALAQSPDYPAPGPLPVTDLADLLPPEAEARVNEALTQLQDETGITALVLTIDSRAAYTPAPTMEAFATDLFNTWRIGAPRDDGMLFYVAVQDREMRIELADGYGADWNAAAQEVINSNVLPYFRDDHYADGIEAGTRAMIRDIARPYAANAPAPEPKGNGNWPVYLAFLSMALLMLRQRLADWSVRLRPCPECGRRDLHRHRDVTTAATTTTKGSGLRVTECRSCGHRDTVPYTIGRVSRSSSSSGGGHSSGGGASGRW